MPTCKKTLMEKRSLCLGRDGSKPHMPSPPRAQQLRAPGSLFPPACILPLLWPHEARMPFAILLSLTTASLWAGFRMPILEFTCDVSFGLKHLSPYPRGWCPRFSTPPHDPRTTIGISHASWKCLHFQLGWAVLQVGD